MAVAVAPGSADAPLRFQSTSHALLFAAEDNLLRDFRADQSEQKPAASAEMQRKVLSALLSTAGAALALTAAAALTLRGR